MSAEYAKLAQLSVPDTSEAGDMWVCRRLGIVLLALGVKRKRGIKHSGQNCTTLYHWGKPTLNYTRADWDEYDTGPTADSWRCYGGETWRYAGNLFDRLPYAELAGVPWRDTNED